jgi:hypothetical protein
MFEGGDDVEMAYNLAVASVRAGVPAAELRIEQAWRALEAVEEQRRYVVWYGRAGLAALRGDVEAALRDLARAISESRQPLYWARRDVAWRDLRDTPEFAELVGPRDLSLLSAHPPA